MVNWYLTVLRKYTVFQGRSGRAEFWWFTLMNVIVAFVLLMAFGAISRNLGSAIVTIYELLILLPTLGLAIRRLHDINKSGWWIFISFVPFVGGLILLIFYILPGTPGENQFGPSPSVAAVAAA
ncbi:MAG: DUF805 domain-containing protein [Vulcanimicrobiaceae bacterium]